MSELAKLATDFLIAVFYFFLGTFVGAAIFCAVAVTVEHFTP